MPIGNMNATNSSPTADSGAKPTKGATPQPSSLDERIFMGFVVVGVLVMLAAMKFAHFGNDGGQPLREYRQVGNFQRIERSGRVIIEADLKGKIVVVDFFFGGCSEQCLTLSR
jgi:hypothetical protein